MPKRRIQKTLLPNTDSRFPAPLFQKQSVSGANGGRREQASEGQKSKAKQIGNEKANKAGSLCG